MQYTGTYSPYSTCSSTKVCWASFGVNELSSMRCVSRAGETQEVPESFAESVEGETSGSQALALNGSSLWLGEGAIGSQVLGAEEDSLPVETGARGAFLNTKSRGGS